MSKNKVDKFKLLVEGLQKLIETVAGTTESVEDFSDVAEPVKKKRGRPPKVKVEPIVEVEEEEEEEEAPVVRKSKRPIKAGKGKVQARKTPLPRPKNRPNLFTKMPEFHAHKDDVLIDKKLNKGKTPTPRRSECTTRVDVECRLCHDIVSVHPDEIGRSGRYTCNDCVVNRGSSSGDYEEDISDDIEE